MYVRLYTDAPHFSMNPEKIIFPNRQFLFLIVTFSQHVELHVHSLNFHSFLVNKIFFNVKKNKYNLIEKLTK